MTQPSNREMLLELAASIEAMREPCRMVDWQIHVRNGLDGVGMYGAHPAYTSSLDAAMTLIDGDTFFHISRFGDGADAHVYPNRYVGDDYKSEAATPALALCSAALRANSTLMRGDEK